MAATTQPRLANLTTDLVLDFLESQVEGYNHAIEHCIGDEHDQYTRRNEVQRIIKSLKRMNKNLEDYSEIMGFTLVSIDDVGPFLDTLDNHAMLYHADDDPFDCLADEPSHVVARVSRLMDTARKMCAKAGKDIFDFYPEL